MSRKAKVLTNDVEGPVVVNILLNVESFEEKDKEGRNVFHYAFDSRKAGKLTKILKDFFVGGERNFAS